MFETILNPVFSPLLKLPSLWAIMLISLLVALLITLIYKWMTDQHLMRKLKEDIKNFQKQMKELKDKPQEVMKVQKRAMQTNMKYMMHSLKPTLITFIPIIIIFSWLNANLAYEPINPGQEFTTSAFFDIGAAGDISLVAPEGIEIIGNSTKPITDNQVNWTLKGTTGNYILEYQYHNQSYQKEILITEQKDYEEPVKVINKGKLNQLIVNNKKVTPLSFTGIPWVKNWGWLGTYIIFSIIFSMSLRKILKIH
ncbi:DUF106 domain-containing protein [Candidatus Woesearchaeota archaeon]|nr:DUF106 domain-containing protein [Candidatus Woesearchaeota archaeon]